MAVVPDKARPWTGVDLYIPAGKDAERIFANNDGLTNVSLTVNAQVLRAFEQGLDLFWPDGIYLTTESIPHFHEVRHRGPGVIKRGANLFYVEPKAGQENTLYCNASTGDDLNDGLSGNTAFEQITRSVEVLDNYGPALGGKWTIQPAAGTYKGDITIPRNLLMREYLTIHGAGGAHPNVPTVIVDFAEDTNARWGFFAQDFSRLWLEQIKIVGAFEQGVYCRQKVIFTSENVHIDGADVGFQFNDHVRHQVIGGIVENCTDTGIVDIFNSISGFTAAGSNADAVTIRNCPTGYQRKESTVGHMDYVNVEDCETGFEIHHGCVANIGNMSFKRCDVGITMVGAADIHEYNNAIWGAGADAVTKKIRKVGNGNVLEQTGWTASSGATIDTGFVRSHGLIAYQLTADDPHTGTTAATTIMLFDNLLLGGVYAAKGANFIARVIAVVNEGGAATSGNITIGLLISGGVAASLVIPSGTAAGTVCDLEYHVFCSADGNSQTTLARGKVGTASLATVVGTSARDLDTVDADVAVRATLANATDSVYIRAITVEG